MRIQVVRQGAGPGRCPFCHETAPAAGQGVECPGCGARLHVECHGLLLRCPTLGCQAMAEFFPGVRTLPVGDRYRGLGRIGPERYGLAVHARDEKLGEDVTLLYLEGNHPAEADAAAAQLAAGHVPFRRAVPITGHGRDPRGNRLFLVREFIPGGESLSRVLGRRGGLLAVPEALWLARIVLDSLSDLHARGGCYGELAAGESILLERREDGVHLRFANHGVGRVASIRDGGAAGGGDGPRPGEIARLAYLTPEQFEDATREDSGSDLYALGVLLYRLLTGELPWQFRSVRELIMVKVRGEPPQPLSGVDPRLAAAILRAFARDPRERYPSAVAFAEALAELA